MRRHGLCLILLLDCAVLVYGQKESATMNVDLAKSVIEWTGKKLTGEHYGEIRLASGNVTLSGNQLTAGVFEMDMNAITCTDITDLKSNKRLVDHLKSEDFFSVTRFPKANFVTSKVVRKTETQYEVTGKLTIKEHTNEIMFRVNVSTLDKVIVIEASLTIDRSKFDVKFGSQSFFENLGDKMVYDDIDLKVNLILKPRGL